MTTVYYFFQIKTNGITLCFDIMIFIQHDLTAEHKHIIPLAYAINDFIEISYSALIFSYNISGCHKVLILLSIIVCFLINALCKL